ncbi:hypothetical protein [Saccharopolyspora sp. NPDC050642]|uniref:hypothetical protein n=1 Tax=Saccharopolyspora sp. NPDC050642 TaxID=3157099 RepID=UPI0033C37933
MSDPTRLLELTDSSIGKTFTLTNITLDGRRLEFKYLLSPGYASDQFGGVEIRRGIPQFSATVESGDNPTLYGSGGVEPGDPTWGHYIFELTEDVAAEDIVVTIRPFAARHSSLSLPLFTFLGRTDG